MTNKSILAAFERMWQHVINALGGKADTDHTHSEYAASSHTHAASNITSGTLGVARGGTGKATHTSNAVLTGNGTSAVNNVATASGALYATAANGAAKFGTLPVAQGGTGATTAAGALTNLGLTSTAAVLNGLDTRVTNIENNGVSVGDTLPIESQVYFDGTEDEIPEGYVKVDAPFSNPNLLINGDFQVWQRGTSITQGSNMSYNADHWAHHLVANTGVVEKDTTNGGAIIKPKGVGNGSFFQLVEGNSLFGKTVTLSFDVWANKEIDTNARVTTWLDPNGVEAQHYKITTAKQRLSFTFNIPSGDLGHTRVEPIRFTSNYQSSADMEIHINNIKLEQGSIATPFIIRPLAEELALCQRYYYVLQQNAFNGVGNSVPTFALRINELEYMRTTPTIKLPSTNINYTFLHNGSRYVYAQDALTIQMEDRHLIISGIDTALRDTSIGMWWTAPYTIGFDAEIY